MSKIKKRNPLVQELRSPKYRKRIVKNKKGKGSYNRQKNKTGDFSLLENIIF